MLMSLTLENPISLAISLIIILIFILNHTFCLDKRRAKFFNDIHARLLIDFNLNIYRGEGGRPP